MAKTYDVNAEPVVHLSMDRDDLNALQDIVQIWWINHRDRFSEDDKHVKLAKSIMDIQLASVKATISYSNGEA